MRQLAHWLVCVGALMTASVSQLQAASLTPDQKQAFEWFDKLGFPTLVSRKWMRVATGEWSRIGDEPPQNRYVNAFLLKEDERSFTVFTTDAFTRTFAKTRANAPEYQRVSYELRNLEQDAKSYLEALRSRHEDARDWPRARFGERISERAEIFILARGCAANGLEELAHDLCAQAESLQDFRDRDKNASFLQQLSNDFAYSMIWRAFLDFEDAKIPRSQLLATFRSFVDHFPKSEYNARAKETADILDRMVKEDEVHAKLTTRPADRMDKKARIAGLIFQLRDQNGQQLSQPGACDIFMDSRGDLSPAAQLVSMGFDAVPPLIDALDDNRLTRSVGFHRGFYFSHHVLNVGDCAEVILSRIAGRRFRDGEASATKREAQKWWAEYQKKGEKSALMEAVALGDRNSVEQCQRLVEKYPEAAMEPITRGVANADDWVRVGLIEQAGHLKGQTSVAFLLEQLTKGASIEVRVAAATALHHRDKPEAVPAMIAEWEKLRKGGARREQAPERLIVFLASSDESKAIRALGNQIEDWPVASRLVIVVSMGQWRNLSVISSGRGPSFPSRSHNQAPSASTLDAIEEVLVRQLDDVEERGGMSGNIDGESFEDPRVCDIAAYFLATQWKNRYTFRLSSALSMRDRQRVDIQNVWRQRHNLPPLPLPKPRQINPVAQDKLQPLLLRLGSPLEQERKKAATDIEQLGLGAIPGLQEAIRILPTNDQKRGAMTLIVRDLSCWVEQVDVSPTGTRFSGPLKTALDHLRGRPLTTGAVVAAMTAFVENPPVNVRGLKLYADREDDLTGITLRLQIITGAPAATNWEIRQRVTAGRDGILDSSGSTADEYLRKSEAWADFTKALDKALQSPPDVPLSMRVAISRE